MVEREVRKPKTNFPPDQLPLAEFKRWSEEGWGLEGFHLIYEDSWIYSQITKLPRFFAGGFSLSSVNFRGYWMYLLTGSNFWVCLVTNSIQLLDFIHWQQFLYVSPALLAAILRFASWLEAVPGFIFLIGSSYRICFFYLQQLLDLSLWLTAVPVCVSWLAAVLD